MMMMILLHIPAVFPQLLQYYRNFCVTLYYTALITQTATLLYTSCWLVRHPHT